MDIVGKIINIIRGKGKRGGEIYETILRGEEEKRSEHVKAGEIKMSSPIPFFFFFFLACL